MPEWDDNVWDKYGDEDENEGDEWKVKAYRDATKKMYNQWREFFGLIAAFADNLDDKGSEMPGRAESIQEMIMNNAYIVAPKIMGAIGGDLYIIKMENASIIRTNCMELMVQVGCAEMFGMAKKAHKNVIKEAMAKYRETFKEWVSTFEKDEFEDEWGLY